MELKQIKELMAAMERTGAKRLVIKKKDFELQLERDTGGDRRDNRFSSDLIDEESFKHDAAFRRANVALSKAGESPSSLSGGATQPSSKEDASSAFVTSPMVGTFYATPSPQDPPFVKPGDKIDKDTVVGIIEAMKVMNEIKAGTNGVIAEILVETGHPVEFGAKLFRIIP